MATPTNPSEIARETLRLLAARRMLPSPDNFRSIYNEIAGIRTKPENVFPEQEIRALVAAMPKVTPVQQRLQRQLDQALKDQNWNALRQALADFANERGGANDRPWGTLFNDFLRQWETKQSKLTPARKREALDHILSSASKNSELLFTRLQNLVKSWSLNQDAGEDMDLVEGEIPGLTETPRLSAEPNALAQSIVAEPIPGLLETPGLITPAIITPTLATGGPQSRTSELLPELRELFAFTLETIVASQLDDEPTLSEEARALAANIRSLNSAAAMNEFAANIKRFAFRLEFLSEDRNELRSGLIKLLQLMVENVSELVADDTWLNGQLAMVRDIVGSPMNIRAINDAEVRLKEVIYKQSQLKGSLIEAKQALKQMLAGFVDHLAEFADSTSDYHDKIEMCVEKISKADNITQLEDVLAEVIKETRIIQINAQRSRDELHRSKRQVDDAEQRINELQSELDKASALVRHDQLTGTLNRRGLEEAFDNEVARSRRRRSALCVALLDIDNFKKLNDTHGHDAGDAALIHLTTVIRDTLRPQDTLARFGGEEFIVLLPDTPVDDAKLALVRLQRALTKRFFLSDNEKLLITFSAGVTDLRNDDTQATIVKRADEAMYVAKQTGKNKVVVS